MSEISDAVVIGGGVIGSAVAYFLSRNQMDVTLLERTGLAGGTSCRCDGNVLVQDKMPGFDSKLTKLSQDLFPEIAKDIDYDIAWTRKGSLTVFESEKEMKVAEEFCAKLAYEGLPVRILNRNEVHGDEPHLAPDVVGGLECACDGSLNPMALTFGLTHGAKKLGAKIRPYTTVTDIALDQKRHVQRVYTDRGDITTKYVVNAAGVWSPEIGKMVGLKIPVEPRQGQILVSERTFPVARRKVMEFGYLMTKFGDAHYKRQVTSKMEEYGVALVFEPTQAGNFLIGSSRRFVGLDTSCHIEVLRAIGQRAIRFFPLIKDIRIIRSYAGLRPHTPDHLPIISETDVPGFYVATGHEGDGIGLSLITGKLILQMIFEQPTEISLKPLRLSRFADQRPGSSS